MTTNTYEFNIDYSLNKLKEEGYEPLKIGEVILRSYKYINPYTGIIHYTTNTNKTTMQSQWLIDQGYQYYRKTN